MIPYYFLIILPIVFYLLGYYKKKKWNKLCIIVFFIIFILMLSLRSTECGTDLKMYSKLFGIFSNSSYEQLLNYSKKGEFLFYFLNKIVYIFGGDFQIFLTVVALISLIPILLLYYKKTDNGLLTLALFLTVAPSYMFFSGLRQSIAMGIIVFGFKYVQEKKLLKYMICVVFSLYFHKSAGFAIVLYPVYHMKIKKDLLYVIVPLYFIVFMFKEQIFSYLLYLYNPIYEESYGSISNTGQYSILLLLILFDIYCFVFPDKEKIDKEFIGLRNILLLSTLCQLFVPINNIVMRMNYYALLFVPILIPKVIMIGYKKYSQILQLSSICMVFFFFSYFIYNGYTGNDALNIFPYIPFWKV